MAIVLLLGVAAVLGVQWRLAERVNYVVATIVRFQAIYWGIAYVARPLYLILFEPSRTDPLADYRLAWYGYGSGLIPVLGIVLLGQTAFSVTLYLASLRSSSRSSKAAPYLSVRSELTALSSTNGILFGILFGLGWIGRILLLIGSGISTILSPLATVSICVILIGGRTRSGKRSRLIVVIAVCSEAIWAVLSASKTPIIALLLAFTIAWTRDLTRSELRRRLPIVILAAIASFLVIQPIKGIDTAARVETYSDSVAPSVVGPVVSLLQRFDLISAVTDAYYFPGKPWMTLSELGRTMITASTPKLQVVDYDNVGIRWTREVRARTNPNQYDGVSLATGPIAEGEALGGLLGVIIESAILGVATIVAGSAFLSGRLPVATAVAFLIFNTYLFERGIIGLAESLSKAIQILVIASILQLVLRPPRLIQSVRINARKRM